MKIVFVGNFHVDYSSENHHANTLESLGHEVVRLQEAQVDGHLIYAKAVNADLLVWVHTHGWTTTNMDNILESLERKGVTTLTYHLDLWLGLERQKDLVQDDFYKNIGHFFTVDKLMADWFNDNTAVTGHYLQAGVYDKECYMLDADKTRDVIFVGSKGYHPEWQYRPQLIDWLQAEYKDRFTHVGGDGQIPTTRGIKLNALYTSSKIAIGDSLCLNFDYPYYWSDRVYETLGRGGFMIHPYIKGMEHHFEDKKHLVFYNFGDFKQLKYLIEYYLYNEEEREAIRKAGHEHVKQNHTYKNRWQSILETVEL